MGFIRNFAGHFLTVTRHRHLVISNCRRAGILWQGLFHDLSKYSPTEFFPGVKYYQGTRSPNDYEREVCGYASAWLHHKGRNKHHFEYWLDYNVKTRVIEPVRMPDKYVVEMFCDRIAASKIYRKEKYTDSYPLEYYMKSKSKRVIHKDTAEFIEKLLTMLAEQGEDAVFEYIRNSERRGKKTWNV
ncbi:MAG: catalase [Oscillospiraceae bacterium]|nr:catalase [Oscillospiraceae bacterium]